jgi:DNA repair exonuclease SbcCD nuclease subunit
MTVTVLHAADLHIDSPLKGLPQGKLADQTRSATRRAFEALVQLALAEKVRVVLLAGDVFDGDWRDVHTGVFFTQQLKRLTDAGMRVFIARGNHDAASKMSRHLTLPPGAKVFGHLAVDSIDLPEWGIAIHGWSFPVESVKDNPLPRYPPPVAGRVNIGVLHTNIDGGQSHGNYAPTSSNDLFAHGYDYWALGHIHKRTVLQQGHRYIVYPGNLQGRHIKEDTAHADDGKGATIFRVADGKVVDLRHHSVDVLRWRKVDVDLAAAETLDQAAQLVGLAVEAAAAGETLPLAVRIQLMGASHVHSALQGASERLRAAIEGLIPSERGILVEKIEVLTTPAAPPVDDALTEALARVCEAITVDPSMRQRFDEALRRDLKRLFEAAPRILQAELLQDPMLAALLPGGSGSLPLDQLAAEAHDHVLYALRHDDPTRT